MSRVFVNPAELILDPADPRQMAVAFMRASPDAAESQYDCSDKRFYIVVPWVLSDGTPLLDKSGVPRRRRKYFANEAVKSRVWQFLYSCYRRDRKGEIVPFIPTTRHVSQTVAAFRAICIDREGWGISA